MLDAEQALQNAISYGGNLADKAGVILADGASGAEANVLLYYRGNPDLIPVALAADTAKKAAAVPAVLNHGRWVVECPSGDGGAQYASREDRRFMCLECLNADVGGLWRPVAWPDEEADIEAALTERPELANQNWVPTETVADLQAENEANQ